VVVYQQKKRKEKLIVRARIIQAVRDFFIDHNYIEVETPIRIPAPAPETHIDAVESGDWFLQTSPELCMKQLLAVGFGRIFQICKCFRKGERGRWHLPEMTMLEWYRINSNYLDMMNECETLISQVARQINSKSMMIYQGTAIDLAPPWRKISVAEAFRRFASMSMEAALGNDRFDEIMVEAIEPNLGQPQPVFLYDYPLSRGALARAKPQDGRCAERFELYIGGLEICNAFNAIVVKPPAGSFHPCRKNFSPPLVRCPTLRAMHWELIDWQCFLPMRKKLMRWLPLPRKSSDCREIFSSFCGRASFEFLPPRFRRIFLYLQPNPPAVDQQGN
jgi:lysyl-tRNA synthetase class 2